MAVGQESKMAQNNIEHRVLRSLESGDIISCPSCDREQMICLRKPKAGSDSYTSCFEYTGFSFSKSQLNGPALAKCQCGVAFCKSINGRVGPIYVRNKGWSI